MTNKYRRFSFIKFLIPLLFLATSINAEASLPVLPLKQVVYIALERNPALTTTQNQVEIAEAKITQIEADKYPQINASAGYDYTWVNNSYQPDGNGTLNISTGITISQNIYDFGKTSAAIDQSNQNL
jgi:outer membrane protein, adhesin transport system